MVTLLKKLVTRPTAWTDRFERLERLGLHPAPRQDDGLDEFTDKEREYYEAFLKAFSRPTTPLTPPAKAGATLSAGAAA